MRNFITIEGCDGVGKTYQTRRLREYCEQMGYDVVFTREPGAVLFWMRPTAIWTICAKRSCTPRRVYST